MLHRGRIRHALGSQVDVVVDDDALVYSATREVRRRSQPPEVSALTTFHADERRPAVGPAVTPLAHDAGVL